jgi:poly-gamma-glutamate synthase PgsB/CapB
MFGIEMLGLLTGGLVGLGGLEFAIHRRNLAQVPIRLHVSGTRGKSSVTRLIASGMNHGGIRAAGKTTGTLARMIFPDQRELPIYRPIGANIIEQKRIVAAAKNLEVKALVAECMALQPYLHWVSENLLIRATHGVITNARADHLDVMGPTEADVARALAGMIPVKGVLYTAERQNLAILKEAADDRGTKLVAVGLDEVDAVTDEEMSGFTYTEHKENVALVIRILEDFGIDRRTAIEGMWKTKPDPGALSEHTIDFFGRTVYFINGFAANDPESTERIWHYAVKKYENVDRVIAVFNLRADRPSRTAQLARDVDFWKSASSIVLMGTGSYLFMKIAIEQGVHPELFVQAEYDRVDDIFEKILEKTGQTSLIVGMGNIGGPGMGLVNFFKNRALLENPK